MESNNKNRTKWLHLRLTTQEYNILQQRFNKSICRKLSEFARKNLLQKPIINKYRNQSLDDLMEETIVLTSELKTIGNNVNQIAKKVNYTQEIPELKQQLFLFEIERKRLFSKMEEINNHTKKIAEYWLQL
ncbi:plasmid mobilization protein [Flavobacterium aquiphilum]|uniref:plasmid mobilization protein n=1 Tax=Flavobacterium aquiphilum TaxID=3003261 RepID=UPI00247FE895|nr:plasmid mobilization relaxosome protein MobC [Flavobacterium aquiphilum]